MAKLDFPDASFSPWVAPNNVIYTYIGTSPNGYWEANTANASTNLTAVFVERIGSTMTGALKLDNSGSVSLPDISFDGDVNTGLFSPGADSLAITTAGTQRFTVDSSGNVSVGSSTTSGTGVHLRPFGNIISRRASGSLQVFEGYQGSTLTSEIRADGGVSFKDGSSRFAGINGGSAVFYGGDSSTTSQSNAKFRLNTDGSASFGSGGFAIDADGEITTNVKSAGHIELDSSGSFSSPKIKLFANSGNATFAGNLIINKDSKLYFEGDADDDYNAIWKADTENTVFITSRSHIANIIDSNNDDISAFWSVRHNGTTRAGSTELMRVESSGKVGIGTASPSKQLEVASANFDTALFKRTNSTGAATIFLSNTSNHGAAIQSLGNGSGGLMFLTQNSNTLAERMRIDSSGRLLVGTTSPTTSSVTTRISAYSNTNDWMLMDIGATQSGDTGGVYGVRSRSASNNPIAVASAYESTTEVTCYYGGGWGGYGRSANNLRFYTSAALDNASGSSGHERMRIDSSGRLGLGVVPSDHGGNSLEIHSGSSVNSFLSLTNSTTGSGGNAHGFNIIMSNNEARLFNREAGDMSFWTSSTERMRIDSSGRVLIGTTTRGYAGAETFTVANSGNAGITIRSGTSNNGTIAFSDAISGTGEYDGYIQYRQGTQELVLATVGAERMRINSSGTVTLGGDDPSEANSSARFFQIAGSNTASGSVFESKATSTSVRYHFLFTYSTSSIGSITTSGSSTAYNTSSDYRLKENVVDIADGITRVKQLAPKRFNFIVDADRTVDGFLAHEAQTVVPEAVTGEKDGEEMQGIDQSKLVPLLTAALQEAIAKIETLEQRLSDAGIA